MQKQMLKDSQVATLNSFLENSQDRAASDLKRTPPSVFYCEVVAADAKMRMLRFPSERLKYNCRVSVNFNLEVLETFDYYFSVSAQSNPRLHILIS